jgi:hypothetical protein
MKKKKYRINLDGSITEIKITIFWNKYSKETYTCTWGCCLYVPLN